MHIKLNLKIVINILIIEEKKWEQVEPIPTWKSPSSIQMSVVSGFFKLSMMLRNIHTQITEEHGIPYWGSYLLFALATIIVGAVLGLILVFLIDCFYPAKASGKRNEQKSSNKKDEKVRILIYYNDKLNTIFIINFFRRLTMMI